MDEWTILESSGEVSLTETEDDDVSLIEELEQVHLALEALLSIGM
jgi:hypothetical protein